MPGSPRPIRKRPNRYHHGDLRRALVQEAVRTIQAQGVERLTLRSVAGRLGVSRTALYRHFTDKSTLLAAVAADGFRTLRTVLLKAWADAGRGLNGLDAMGIAYVEFAVTHPSHYRVMFGRYVEVEATDSDLVQEGTAAFAALVDALVELQQQRLIGSDEPGQLARFVWATVHGIAMLGIDGQLDHQGSDGLELARFGVARVRDALTRPGGSPDKVGAAERT
jgi:AcrR family transcriptional regulator